MAPWSKEQNTILDQRNNVSSYSNLHRFFDAEDGYDDDGNDWYDDGPTSCRDIISGCDMDDYYSD
jgi:exonuclease 3'-5' domain-containing protein 1